MRITIATPYLPYPDVPHGGGQDLFQLIQALGQRHRVSVVSFTDEAQAAHAAKLRPYVAHLHLVWPATTRRQKWQNALAALRQGRWRRLGRRAAQEMEQAIARSAPNVLHCAWTEMGRYLTAVSPDTVRVLEEVDVRFLVEESMADNRRLGQRRAAELAYCRTADLVLTRSQRDLAVLQQAIPGLRSLVLPPVAHLESYASIKPEESVPGRVLFVGHMGRRRNQEAVTWLTERVWPVVYNTCPNAVLHIAGAEPPAAIRALAQQPGIVVTGWVPELRREYAQARVVVAPLLAEAGALNKVLDGLAAGRPVIATPQANAGIAAPPGAIALAQDAQQFALAIVRLLENKEEWLQRGRAGRRYVLAAFDRRAAVRQYLKTIKCLALLYKNHPVPLE